MHSEFGWALGCWLLIAKENPMIAQVCKRLSFALVLCAVSTAASANYTCQGTVTGVSLNQAGVVTVSSPSSGLPTFYVCQIGATTNGVGPEQCKAMLGMLYIARVSGQQVQWHFSDSLTCATHANWDWLSGWYFGPTIMD
jgi:hypothetical protein